MHYAFSVMFITTKHLPMVISEMKEGSVEIVAVGTLIRTIRIKNGNIMTIAELYDNSGTTQAI